MRLALPKTDPTHPPSQLQRCSNRDHGFSPPHILSFLSEDGCFVVVVLRTHGPTRLEDVACAPTRLEDVHRTRNLCDTGLCDQPAGLSVAQRAMRWCDPDGRPHEVARDGLWRFCKDHGLNFGNMVNHIDTPSSDQKNGGWRLVDRLRVIGPVDQPTVMVPVLGAPKSFFTSCLTAMDGREKMTSKENLNKLLAGPVDGRGNYKGGKPYQGYERRTLSSNEKWALLHRRLGLALEVRSASASNCACLPARQQTCSCVI